MRCTKCGTESTTGRKFCAACGSPLSSRCPKCGAENAPASVFCEDCGSALAVNAAPAATRSPQTGSTAPNIRITPEQSGGEATDGERKTITVLFADIKGSMRQIEDLDPEEARAIVDPALEIMAEAVNRYQGHVAQSTGDGVFALFGAPIAHEDHPQRAIYAAMRMQEELRRYSDRIRSEGKAPVEIRIGINTGEVVMRSVGKDQSHTEYLPAGHAVGLASRLQTIAPTGSIAISEQTCKFAEGYFQLKSLGPARVKGVSEPVNVYEVMGLGPLRTRLQRSAGRGYAKFVGREREMETLKHAAEQAKGGRGQIAAAMAEPGVGKSRLFFEFKVTSLSGWMVLEAVSISHGKASAYLPVIDLLHGYFKIAIADDRRTRREKVSGKVLALDRSLEGAIPYLFSVLGVVEGADPLAGMDAQIKRRRTLDAIKRILLRESLNQPLIVVFEDLHWIDGETQALLNLLADSIATAKILLLVNYRPEYHHEWGSKTYYTQLRLDPLGKESADEMLSAMLGDGVELAPLKRLIIDKTEGNPFFMEETVQVMFDEGALARNGTVRLTKSTSQVKIPPTVQAILASRIDRLPLEEKDLLQTLAVLGREFPFGLVKSVVANSEDELNRMLSDLQLGEFIYEQPASGDVKYTFKHALTQEVAYNSVLIGRRKLVHERAGAAMEALYSERLDDHLSAIAHQYSQSRNARKAIHYLRLAGVQAAQRSGSRESLAYFRNGLELLRSLPETVERKREELDLLLMLGPATMTLAGYGAREAQELYQQARVLCGELNDNTKLFPVLWGLWMSHGSRVELHAAWELAVELLSVAEALGDDTFKLEAHHARWNTLMYLGELKDCLIETERGVALYDPRTHAPLGSLYGGHDPGVCGKNHAAQVLWLLGYPDRALKCTSEALALAQELGHPNSFAQALAIAAMGDQYRRERAVTAKRAEVVIAVSVEQGLAQWVTMGTILRGWGESDPMTSERDLAKMRAAVADWRAPGTRFYLPYFLALAAEVCCELESVDEAIELVAEALDLVDRTGERWYEAELHRLSGELLWVHDSSSGSAAERSFRTAIEIAQKQEAKSLELRATTSLARLLVRQGKRVKARAMLAQIYGWFTEGFDTADLKDAKALLNELEN
jgi:class 3 adenylate cyclase/predicted ATPase